MPNGKSRQMKKSPDLSLSNLPAYILKFFASYMASTAHVKCVMFALYPSQKWSCRESNSNIKEDLTQMLKKTLLNLCIPIRGKDNIVSPETKLLKEELRILLPMIARPKYKTSAEKQPNKKHCQLHPLNLGDHICIHDGRTWPRKGKIIECLRQPQSYLVQLENGKKLQCNC